MAELAAASKPRTRSDGRHGSALWIQGLACGACLTFAAPTALLISILLAPALICLLASPGVNRGLLRSVSVACAAASLSPVWHLWLAGDRFDQALAALSEPFVLLIAWGAGASAWALCQVIPIVLRVSWDVRSTAQLRAIEFELKKLHEDWLLEVASEPSSK